MAGGARGADAKGDFKRETLTVNGIKTALLSAGQGEPLVFFHGGGVFHGFDFALPWTEHLQNRCQPRDFWLRTFLSREAVGAVHWEGADR